MKGHLQVSFSCLEKFLRSISPLPFCSVRFFSPAYGRQMPAVSRKARTSYQLLSAHLGRLLLLAQENPLRVAHRFLSGEWQRKSTMSYVAQ